ncbi:hypothetical protein TcasGA2_TC008398 [Tribolium castaneum]|uniref:Uncharacterized protein n=1 Tax=Tribolium castaneum TaxID=7070 RepID=D2A1K1_TRICA|nr:hypothetical protein TcasGA2_TC008398 [Tribolium castaneum]
MTGAVKRTLLPGLGTAPIFSGGAPKGTGDRRKIPGSAGWQTQANIFYRGTSSSAVRIYEHALIKGRQTPVGFCLVVYRTSDHCNRCLFPVINLQLGQNPTIISVCFCTQKDMSAGKNV